ncbi:hypothetical protein LLE49_20440 [Alicyclobacillus tolerans]|uniref:hypothetical protein n=1 Tax=Alicyclobacillus tolerans TaxID=90970 RepID=UPI001F2C73CB|nr:hypothetical protein [Alicyclobacillus tolerans]MCF8567090.1 hypothetical protein [Alicyclobacillus tolerans]
MNEETIVVDQRVKHAQWDFMLRDDTDLIHNVPNNTKNQALSTKLLYALQNYAPEFNRDDIQHVRQQRLYWLVRFIQGETEEHYLTVDLLLDSLRKTSLDIESFSQLTVPEEYKMTLLSDRAKSVQPGPCLAPWCASYGSNHDMKPITHLMQVSKNYQAFRTPYVCTSCFVKYGYSRKQNSWSESGELIKLGWHKVVPLLQEGIRLLNISRECKVSIYRIQRIRGYFYGRGIVPGDEPIPSLTEETLQKFKDAYFQEKSRIYAAKVYGWTPLVYWALYGSNMIQNYIVFQHRKDLAKFSKRELTVEKWEMMIKEEIETRLQNGLPITLADISSAVGCSAVLISKYGLAPLIREARAKRNEEWIGRCQRFAEEYLGSQDDIYTNVSIVEFRKITGMGHWWLHQHVPEILRRIDEEQQRRLYQRRIRTVQASIEQLKEDNLSVTINAVIRVSGLDRALIFKDPFLKDMIYNYNNEHADWEVEKDKSERGLRHTT